MSDLLKRLAALSPEKQKLLAQALQQHAGAADTVPLSFAQQRLWFLDQWAPGNPVYHLPGILHIEGPLDVAALQRSLQEIVRRHEILRTSFITIADQPLQLIHPHGALSLQVADLQGRAVDAQDALVQELARAEACRPFDLSQGPLLRVTVLRLGQQRHVLLLTTHHIVADGWSFGVFWRELAAFYAAAVGGTAAQLPNLPFQYGDYARWQRQWLDGPIREVQLAYWRRQLAGAPPLLTLPTDRARPSVATSAGARVATTLPASLVEGLRALSRQEGATLFMTLLAGWQALLARYSGQDDIVVGTPIAGRTRVELEALIGCFVNTLALRTDLSGNPSVRELIRRVRDVCVGAYAHQDLPFEVLVEALRPERVLSHTPLFQVLFALQNAPMPALELAGLTLTPEAGATDTAKFDLALDLTETPAGLSGYLEYSTDLFEAATVARMAGHFQTLLEGMLADPERPIAALPLLTGVERQQLLVEWNATQAPYQRDRCIHELFESQAAATPDALAVSFEQRSTAGAQQATGAIKRLTYAELNARANQLAHYLRAHGVGPEIGVGVCLERSVELVVALLGILKAGGAYVPLDPAYPEERLAFMVQDAKLAVLITDREMRDWRSEIGRQHQSPISNLQSPIVVDLIADWPAIAERPTENPKRSATPANLAYVIYTSGSTGRPKGVGCCHEGVINFLADFTRRQPLAPGDACSCWTSISFDVSGYEIWSALLAGGVLHLVPEHVRSSGPDFIEWLQAHEIRSAYVPPFLLHALDEWLGRGSSRLSLRRLLVGVEPIPEALLASICARIPGVEVINGYGPTEASIGTIMYVVQPASAQDRNTPIGRPVQNTQIYLLDQHLQPVPIGVPGEVYIGGVSLGRG
jgi:amino acid adenylation domain-containing protein